MEFNKEMIYPKVMVYHDMLPKDNDFIELLKESEHVVGGKYYFEPWEEWQGYGTWMKGQHLIGFEHFKEPSDEFMHIPHAKKQYDFIKTMSEVFLSVTRDYVKDWDMCDWAEPITHLDLEKPDWCPGGIVVLKYETTKPEKIFNDLIMQFHTDTHEFNKDSPGLKFGITCTIYINDDYGDGELEFLDESTLTMVKYKPKAGDVTVFPSGEPYFHAVHKISSGEKYFIRNFWFWNHPGSKEWLENEKKYGKDEWEKMEYERVEAAFNSGQYHRHVINEGDLPNPNEKTPAVVVKNRRVFGENND